MDDLRAVYESLGLKDAETFIQSGNVIFLTGERDLTKLVIRIEKAIEKAFGFHSDVILRTAAELREVIAANPFAGRADVDNSRLLATFLASDPGDEARAKVRALRFDPEEIRIVGRELYIHYPNGVGRSKLQPGVFDKLLSIPGTARNWNTVLKLSEMAEAAER